ncbi:MAG: hypothetical protein IKV01_04805, partial [Clostridia bacterium]|nr:hypothetical protein [Clostridia bacterium]
SLPICVIMGLHRRAGACSRRKERLESKKAAGVNPRPTKGYGLCPKPCVACNAVIQRRNLR